MSERIHVRSEFRRRDLLAGTAVLLLSAGQGRASTIFGQMPWAPNAGDPPARVQAGPWLFFSGDEGRAMEAIADRIIPPDPETPGGRDSGCAVFIDRQLAGPFGEQDGLYVRPPFQQGLKNQGEQSEGGPRQKYRSGLAAFDKACKAKYAGKEFADLSDSDKDKALSALESGELSLDGVDGKAFFAELIKDVQ